MRKKRGAPGSAWGAKPDDTIVRYSFLFCENTQGDDCSDIEQVLLYKLLPGGSNIFSWFGACGTNGR